jgi:hypothetical protein
MPRPTTNWELVDLFYRGLLTTTITDVNEDQPCAWKPREWSKEWTTSGLPYPEVIEEIADHFAAHGRIKRRFVLDFSSRGPLELLIASMAWGFGDTPYGPRRMRDMLANPGATSAVLEEILTALDNPAEGLAAGFRLLFDRRGNARIPNLGIAFGTKFVYFARYESELRPRPLIYDDRVAHTAVHLPTAPLLPGIDDGLKGKLYERFCQWAEELIPSDPVIVEYVAFGLGKTISDSI